MLLPVKKTITDFTVIFKYGVNIFSLTVIDAFTSLNVPSLVGEIIQNNVEDSKPHKTVRTRHAPGQPASSVLA